MGPGRMEGVAVFHMGWKSFHKVAGLLPLDDIELRSVDI